MKIEITPDLRLLASVWGSFRTFVSRADGVVDRKIGPQSGADADMDGLLGELAFCQAHNIWPDLGMKSRSGSYDCMVRGTRIDIKTTRHTNGRLLCTLKDNPDVDVYVLAILTDTHVNFVGCAYKHELCKKENIVDLGYGKKGYALDQSRLIPITR